MKILHTADTHLGDLNGPVRDGKNARRQDTLACMKHIVEVAEKEKPNVSIVAGDLFNRSRVWADTALDDVNDAITTFLRPLCRCSEQVVLLFGTENHDNPRAFETVREITKDEANLHIYTTPGIERLTTSEGDMQILALPGFDKGRLRLFVPGVDKETENRNATALINDVLLGLSTELDKSIPAILVAHYTVAGAEADNGSTFLAGQDVVILHRQHRRRPRVLRSHPPPAEATLQHPGVLLRQSESAHFQRRGHGTRILHSPDDYIARQPTGHGRQKQVHQHPGAQTLHLPPRAGRHRSVHGHRQTAGDPGRDERRPRSRPIPRTSTRHSTEPSCKRPSLQQARSTSQKFSRRTSRTSMQPRSSRSTKGRLRPCTDTSSVQSSTRRPLAASRSWPHRSLKGPTTVETRTSVPAASHPSE